MPDTTSFAGFAALSLAVILVPGPSVLFVVSRAVALGRRAALTTVVGNAAGAYVQVLLVAAGLGAVVERSIAVFTVVKLVGAAYLVWLGVSAIVHRRSTQVSVVAGPRRSTRSLAVDGFVVGVANPKLIVFFVAILPQFVDRSGAPPGLQMAVLGSVFVALALACDSLWGLAAGTARDWFARSPRRLERLTAAGGAVMVGLGVRLAVTGRGD